LQAVGLRSVRDEAGAFLLASENLGFIDFIKAGQ
jgi:hypothetical protein